MPIGMLMETHDSRMWTVFLTFVQLVSARSKLKMLLAAILLGQLNSPIKASPSTSPSLVLVRKIPSIDFLLVPKSRRSSVTRCSKAKSYGVPKTQLTEQDPDADDFGETTQSWRIEYEDQEQEDCNEREMERIAYGNLPQFDPHKHRDDDYIGLNGETSWILVTDHFSRMKHGDTRVSKASPINGL